MAEELNIEAVLEAVNHWLYENDRNRLSPLHGNLLKVLWQRPNCGYKAMVEELRPYQKKVTYGYLRNEGAALWKTLSRITEETVEKGNAVEELRRWYRRSRSRNSLQLPGRSQSIDLLTRQLQDDQYRVICLTGMPKTGKSELINAAVRELKHALTEGYPFTPHWFHAERVPTVQHFCRQLYRKLDNGRDGEDQVSDPVEVVLEILREQRLLLILDDADILYNPHQPPGVLGACSEYEDLLRQMISDPTIEGCLVWVSRVPPQCLVQDHSALCRHELPSLATVQAAALLEAKRLLTTAREERQQLIEFCGGNPGLLLAVAQKIDESFAGRISQYLANPFHILSQIDELWIEIVATLSHDEKVLLVWLMLRPISAEGVAELAIPNMPPRQRLLAMQYLRRRGLIRVNQEGHYQFHTTYCRYVVAQWLVTHISTKVLDKEDGVKTLSQYPILLPINLPHLWEWQHQFVLEPIVRKIRVEKWQQQDYAKILGKLRGGSEDEDLHNHGYAAGTILNLAMTLKVPFSALNIKGLHIRCADLREAMLKNTDLTGCVFEETALPTCFTGKLVADMSADGTMIAIGDEQGRLGVWVKHDKCFTLEKYYRFGSLPKQSSAVQRVTFSPDELVIAVGKAIHRWILSSNDLPTYLMGVEDEVRCLSRGGDCIAVGLANGRVYLNDLFQGKELDRPIHRRPISLVELDHNGYELATVSYGDRVLLSDVNDLTTVDDIPSGERIVQAIRWQADDLLVAATRDGQPSFLRRAEHQWQDFSSVRGITRLAFSRNGRFLVGISEEGAIYRWNQGVLDPTQVSLPNLYPEVIVLSDDGKHLLTVCHYRQVANQKNPQIQLWDISTGCLFWELKTADPSWLKGLKLAEVRGMTAAQRQHLGEFSI